MHSDTWSTSTLLHICTCIVSDCAVTYTYVTIISLSSSPFNCASPFLIFSTPAQNVHNGQGLAKHAIHMNVELADYQYIIQSQSLTPAPSLQAIRRNPTFCVSTHKPPAYWPLLHGYDCRLLIWDLNERAISLQMDPSKIWTMFCMMDSRISDRHDY